MAQLNTYFEEDIVEPGVHLDEKGWIELPEGPGIGVEMIPGRFENAVVSHESLL